MDDSEPLRVDVFYGCTTIRTDSAYHYFLKSHGLPIPAKPKPYRRPWWLRLLLFLRIASLKAP